MSDDTPTRTPKPMAVPAPAPGPFTTQLMAALQDGGVSLDEAEADPSIMAAIIVANISAAKTLEEAFSNVKSIGAAELVDEGPFIVQGVTLRKSALADGEGSGVYVLVDAVKAINGDRILINTGSTKIMGELGWAVDHGHIPGLAVEVIEVAAARRGQNAPLGLRLVPVA